MTSDEKFLKEAGVTPCEIPVNWMEWRGAEIEQLRASIANWIGQAREEAERADRWKLVAFAGWALAVMLAAIPLIERLGR
jgi:hypothetical protein